MRVSSGFAAILITLAALCGRAATTRKNAISIRGQDQTIYFYQNTAGRSAAGKILFVPGDGGWRSTAETMAQTMASWGYDVCGFDTKRYLEGFTRDGKPALSESQVAADLAQVAAWASGRDGGRVLMVGWSEGAAIAALAAASNEGKRVFGGVALVGLPLYGVLGWKLTDTFFILAHREPNEPRFQTAALLPGIAPLPVWMIYGTADEYTTPTQARRLFGNARDAKRIVFVEGANHRFDGRSAEYYGALKEGLSWLRNPSASVTRTE